MEDRKYVITIGRQYGSGGCEVGQKVAQMLGIPYYDKELLAVAARESGLSDSFLEEYDERPTRSFLYTMVVNPQAGINSINHGKTVEEMAYEAQREALYHVAEAGPCVIVGRSADYILRKKYNLISVFISGEMDFRIQRVMEKENLTEAAAEKKINRIDRARASFYNGYSDERWGDAATYDLCYRHGKNMSEDSIACMIVDYVKQSFLGDR